MQLCISQSTTLSAPFADDVSAFAGVEWPAVEVWLTKLEKHLETVPAEDVRRTFSERNIRPAAAAYQGGLLLSQGEQRKAHFDHFRRRLELCQAVGIPTMLVAADYSPKPDPQAWQRAVVSLKQAGQWAAAFDVRLGFEFRGVDAFCTSLDTAIGLVEAAGEPNVGVCLDVFHYFKGPSKPEDLAGLTRENLVHVQLCDVAGAPRELMTDADRVLPGDGEFRYDALLATLKRIGYDGPVSLELMNPVLWEMKLTQVAELGLMALRRVVG
jgi:2-keto-myo-inositol isomerase